MYTYEHVEFSYLSFPSEGIFSVRIFVLSNKETERVRAEKEALIAKIDAMVKSHKEALATVEERHESLTQVSKDEWVSHLIL